jgi:hypothetical protein
MQVPRAPWFTAIGGAVVVAVAAVSLSAQSAGSGESGRAPRTNGGSLPKTPDGTPDLQGTWSFATLTPFERPEEFGTKAMLTKEEAEAYAKRTLEQRNMDRRDGGSRQDVERAYNNFWWDFGKQASLQTSLVIDPPDGKLPPMTEQAKSRPRGDFGTRFDNPEERPTAERCILGFNSGPPMLPSAYNNNMQLVQTKDQIVIFNEMIHSARIVRLNGTHPPDTVRTLIGDSIGHWEGSTLVVDTTNFAREGMVRGSSRNLHLIERFSLADKETLKYEFTVDDPATWTRQWTASVPMSRTDDLIFEYACHEGNHALAGVLRGARVQEQKKEQK